MSKRISARNIVVIITALLILDQVVKILVKTQMTLDQSITIFPNWFFIRFIENPGAAFGAQLGGEYGKLILSLFRVILTVGLVWYITYLIKKSTPKGVVIGFCLILAGAVGNIIDSAFYGMIFSESTYYDVATFLPEGGGYAGFLHGKVVDMLYFPLFNGTYPLWMPWVGGDTFTFFSPIFNIADSYITIGLLYLLIFQQKFFNSSASKGK